MRLTEEILKPHQREIRSVIGSAIKEDKRALIFGGRGTFKTSTIVHSIFYFMHYAAHYWKGLRVAVAAPNYPQLQEVFVETLIEQAPSTMWKWKGSRRIEMLGTDMIGEPLDAAFILRHAGDEGEGLSAQRAAKGRRGSNLTGFLISEGHLVSRRFATEIFVQTRKKPSAITDGWKPPWSIQILDCNPGGHNHWINQIVLDSGSPYYRGEGYKVLGIPSTPETTDKTEAELADLRAMMSPEEAARDLDAQWIGNVGAMFPVGHEHIDANEPAGGRWYLTFDYGYEPDPFVALLCKVSGPYVWVAGEVRVLRELQDGHMIRVQQLTSGKEISGLTGDPNWYYSTRTADKYRGNVWFGDEMNCMVLMTSNERKPGWKKVQRLLLETVEGRPKLTFSPECEYLISTLKAMRYHEAQTKQGDSVPGDDHAPDALRYLVMSEACYEL